MSYRPLEQLEQAAKEELRALRERKEPLKPRDRLQIPLQEMPSQCPEERRHNVDAVALGYGPEQARVEALRCLQCKNAPCVAGCPVEIDIPGFIAAIAEGDFQKGIDIIKQKSVLPAVCGRVCPQESQCQAVCTVGKAFKEVDRAVSIGRLERFVADWERGQGRPELPAIAPDTGRRVAVVGSGPASITVAADVRRAGHHVTMFEAFHKAGGVLLYGIPEFRLPKDIVHSEIQILEAMGVEIRTNFVVGRTRKLTDLLTVEGYDAVFVGTGAGLPRFMGIEGESLIGVFSANEYLTRTNLMRAYDREHAVTPIYDSQVVAVIGGGNVAMDAARMAVRLGAREVHLLYRRTRREMPARVEEVQHAEEEGVRFQFLTNPIRILGDSEDRVVEVECLRYELGERDDSGRCRPVPVPGSEFRLAVDTVIVAIGNASNPLISQTTPELETNRYGNIVVDEAQQSSIQRIYAGGDIVLGAATVILAMGEGRKAARAINAMLASSNPKSSSA